jgi:hypothetical protein
MGHHQVLGEVRTRKELTRDFTVSVEPHDHWDAGRISTQLSSHADPPDIFGLINSDPNEFTVVQRGSSLEFPSPIVKEERCCWWFIA